MKWGENCRSLVEVTLPVGCELSTYSYLSLTDSFGRLLLFLLFVVFLHITYGLMATSQNSLAISSGDLVDLVSSSGSATIYPSNNAIHAVLQARFHADLPYTRIGCTNLLVVNPYKALANVNDVSAKEYEERSYKDTSLPMLDSLGPSNRIYTTWQLKFTYLCVTGMNHKQLLLGL